MGAIDKQREQADISEILTEWCEKTTNVIAKKLRLSQSEKDKLYLYITDTSSYQDQIEKTDQVFLDLPDFNNFFDRAGFEKMQPIFLDILDQTHVLEDKLVNELIISNYTPLHFIMRAQNLRVTAFLLSKLAPQKLDLLRKDFCEDLYKRLRELKAPVPNKLRFIVGKKNAEQIDLEMVDTMSLGEVVEDVLRETKMKLAKDGTLPFEEIKKNKNQKNALEAMPKSRQKWIEEINELISHYTNPGEFIDQIIK